MSTLDDYLAFARTHPSLFSNPPQGGFEILLGKAEIGEVEAQTAQRLAAKGLPMEWAQVGIAYRDQYLFILRDAVRFPGGFLGSYIRIVGEKDKAPGVVVLPLYQGKVLLLRHFRHATRTWHLELPRGFGMKGLSSEEMALRELQEEIGGTSIRLISLGQIHPDTGMTSECDELFFAEVESYSNAEEFEGIIEILPTAAPELERLIRENEITDGFTIAAYTRAKLRGLL